jgi:hypothetical protein
MFCGGAHLSVNDHVNYLKKKPKRLYGAFLLLTREAYVAVGR